MLCSFLLGTGTGNVIPSSETISGSLTQSLRCLENSSFFSSQHCKGDTIHWPDSLPSEENGSLTMVTAWYLHLCSLFGTGDSMWTGWLHECPINWQHPQDIELGQMFVLSAWQSLFNAFQFQCSALSGSELEQATWFLAARGFLDALTQQHQKQNPLPNTRFEVSGKLQLFQPSTLQRRHYSLTWLFAKWREWFSHSGHWRPHPKPFLNLRGGGWTITTFSSSSSSTSSTSSSSSSSSSSSNSNRSRVAIRVMKVYQ